MKWNRTMRKFCRGQRVIPILYIGIQISWKKQHESNIVCFLCIYVISDVHVWRRALLKTKNAASGSVVALPAYTHKCTLTHTENGVTGSIFGRLWQSHDAVHSLAAMKLMWGLVRGNSGRLLLNSVIFWTNDGWNTTKQHNEGICFCFLRKCE